VFTRLWSSETLLLASIQWVEASFGRIASSNNSTCRRFVLSHGFLQLFLHLKVPHIQSRGYLAPGTKYLYYPWGMGGGGGRSWLAEDPSCLVTWPMGVRHHLAGPSLAPFSLDRCCRVYALHNNICSTLIMTVHCCATKCSPMMEVHFHASLFILMVPSTYVVDARFQIHV